MDTTIETPRPIFDKYAIIRRLAVGGMGEIFLARQSGVAGFDRWVILKAMLPSLAADDVAVNMFLDEARLAATLNHPNIISIYEVGRWEGSYFIAMEYLPGDNLSVLMHAARAMKLEISLKLAARIVHDAALGLDHAHYSHDADGKLLQIIHRDVSPHNIMVTMEGMTKLVDFGIAKSIERDARTMTQLVRGKLRYMPPEQLLRDPVDGRSDQFALGIVFWELCTGQQLFNEEKTDLDCAMAIASRPIPKPSSVRRDVPKELDSVIMRMLQRTPSARFPRCLEVARALAPWLGEYLGTPGTEGVGGLVDRAIGAKIRERTEIVRASAKPAADNFLISFEPTLKDPAPKEAPAWKGLVFGAAVFLGLLIAAAIVAAFVYREPEQLVVKDLVVTDPVGKDPVVNIVEPPKEVKTPTIAAVVEVPPPPKKILSKLAIRSSPAGARVYDGVTPLGETPLDVEVEPGVEHGLILKKEGFADFATEIVLAQGEAKNLEVALAPTVLARPIERPIERTQAQKPVVVKERVNTHPKAAPDAGVAVAPVPPGYLTIDSTPWSNVSLDGKDLGRTPLLKLEVEPGKHTVRLVNDQAKIDVFHLVVVQSGQTAKVNHKQ